MPNSGTPALVFIVEDNDPDVFLVEEALRSQGIPAQIQRCHDGEEAIQALSQIGESGVPHVIIIDLNLPKVTGLEVLKHVRNVERLNGVPVLILPSSQSRTDRGPSIQHGANAYIGKPPTLPEFLSTVGSGIRALLERSDMEPRACPRPSTWRPLRTQDRFRTFQPNMRRVHGGRARINSAI